MLKYFLLGIGFMLLIEGLVYFFFTQQIIKMMKVIENIGIDKIKFVATIISIIGACLIYFTIKGYDI